MDAKRFRTNDFALTYPRCDVSPDAAVEQLRLRMDDKWTYVAFVQEKHEDGAFHLHAHVQTKSVFNATPRSFDLMFGGKVFHPNVQKTKDSSDWKKYMEKEGQIVSSGQFSELKFLRPGRGLPKKTKLTNKELLEGDVIQLVDEEKLSLFSLAGVLKAREMYKLLKPVAKEPVPEKLPDNWKNDSTGIACELFLKRYPEKQRHYWLHSAMPNKGKTTFLQLLRERYETSDYSCQEKYQKVSTSSDFLLFDEFGKGNSVTYTVMNQICDGTYLFPAKGREAVKMAHPWVILCSNFSILDVYPSSNGRIEARFNEICLDNLTFI